MMDKFRKALLNLKPDVECTSSVIVKTEEDFNKIEWNTGVDEIGSAITTTINPHSELTWEIVSAEMDKVQTEYDAQDYARKRADEYPPIKDLVVALYDTDDKAAIEAKRAEIKLKYPKP